MAVSVTADIEGVDEALRRLEDLPDELAQSLATALNTGGRIIESEAKRNLTQAGAVNTGNARASIGVRVEAEPRDLEVVVAAGGELTEADGFDYTLALEFGTRPHFPPVKALTGQTESLDRWVELNISVGSDETPEQIAFLISRKISQRGTPELRFMRDAFNDSVPKITKLIQNAFDDFA